MRVDREELLQKLRSVQAGLTTREVIEQSSCFVFKDGEIITYNDEVACRCESPFGDDLTGAVQAKPLLAILEKLQEEVIEVEVEGNEFIIRGKRRASGIRIEAEVMLVYDKVDYPGKWKELHYNFLEAISIVQMSAGSDETQFACTCVHIHPRWIEAGDKYQATRFKIKTRISQPTLVRRNAIRNIIELGMTEFSETENWIHFRNPEGLILSCRHWLDPYPDLTEMLNVEGEETVLPKGLDQAAERAEIFSGENADKDLVLIQLKPGKLRIKGQGISGWYIETKKIRYQGPPLEFLISPKLLIELTKKDSSCEVTEDRLRVNGSNWVYVAILGRVESTNGREES